MSYQRSGHVAGSAACALPGRLLWMGLAACMLVWVAAMPVRADARADADLADEVAVVESFHAALKAALAQTDFEARRALLAPAITHAFDIETIARISVGSQWGDLTAEQQAQLVHELSELIIATYAARFEGDNGQSFKTLEARELKPGRILVRTMLMLKNRDDVSLDYLLRIADDGRPVIYNVTADGVSDLSLRRAEYTAIIKRDGFDALLEALRQNARDFAAEATHGADAGA